MRILQKKRGISMEKKKVTKKIFQIIGIILLVVFILFMTNIIRKLVIIKDIQRTASQYISSTNYHAKSISNDGSEKTMIVDSYAKNDKKLMIMETIQEEKVLDKISVYYGGGKQNIYFDLAEGKTAELDTEEALFVSNLYEYFEGGSNLVLFCSAIFSHIDTTTYQGKECYRVTNFPSSQQLSSKEEISEVYIDKDTGLVIKSQFGDTISEKEYEFGNVNDEVFVEPDIKEYEVRKK